MTCSRPAAAGAAAVRSRPRSHSTIRPKVVSRGSKKTATLAYACTTSNRPGTSPARAAPADRRRQKHETRAAARAPAWFVPAEPPGLDAAAAAAALAALPLDQREAIVAHLWGGLTFEQLGRLTGTSAATAYRRYAAGL